ncbi:hypothetical protein [Dyella choica]|uniref:Uncharacterized protein n=1 Tax=Dyella choica TaxID=1927959 RepID=A0A3S0R5K9_9GAMM|nr:hypothetical protein [Dyella choica]RUL78388.1 hypothetical protein EKH80_06085 [Dyella choica]
MSEKHPPLDLDQYRALAEDWFEWNERLWPKPSGPGHFNSQIWPLALAAKDQGMWELAVTAAGFAQLIQPPLIRGKADQDLSLVVNALVNRPEWVDLSGFGTFAGQVVSTPLGMITDSARHLNNIFKKYQPVAATSMGCLSYCRDRHPEDREAFLRCLDGC